MSKKTAIIVSAIVFILLVATIALQRSFPQGGMYMIKTLMGQAA